MTTYTRSAIDAMTPAERRTLAATLDSEAELKIRRQISAVATTSGMDTTQAAKRVATAMLYLAAERGYGWSAAAKAYVVRRVATIAAGMTT